MRFHVVTIFPEMFDSYLADSIIGRAIHEKKISVEFYNPRDYTKNKHKRVDDSPYGGGPGMVMQVEPILEAVAAIRSKIQETRDKKKQDTRNKRQKWPSRVIEPKIKTILFSPGGKQFTNVYAHTLAKKYTDIIMICGRYEGVDARVRKILRAEEISIGDYILTGGELPAMVVVDATTRRLPDVLGTKESLEESRTASHDVYTRPEVFEHEGKKYRVPKVLLSGDHKKIEQWRRER